MKARRKRAGRKAARPRGRATNDALDAAKEALRKSEERHRQLVEMSPAGIYMMDATGSVTYVNPRVEELTGYSAEYLLREGWQRILHGAARETVIRDWTDAIARAEPFQLETEIIRPDGTIAWLLGDTRPQFDANGKLTGFVGAVSEVTSIRETELALRESESRYRLLFDRNPNPMCVYERESLRFLDVNDAMVRHYGYSHDEFLAMNIREIRPPEDIPKLMRAVETTDRELATAGVFRHLKKNGEMIEMEVRSRLTELSGRAVVLCLLTDVTERMRAERALMREEAALREITARLNHLLSTSPTILYSTRIRRDRTEPTWISDSVTRLLGYTPLEAMAPDWWITNLHPDDRERVIALLPQMLADGFLICEYRFVRKDGTPIWVRDESRILSRTETGDVEVVGTWSDITERRVFEERLRLDAAAIESTRDGVLITGLDGIIVAVNRSLRQSVGYEEHELLGRNPDVLRSGRHGPEFFREMWHDLASLGHWQGEIWNRRKDGEVFPVWVSISAVYNEQGTPTHYVAVYTDITKLKQSEEELEHLAHFDPLTDLPNRLLLQSRLEHAVDQARRRERLVGVLFIDLDDFKKVNDSLGHAIGDELLVAVAGRLGGRVREEDTLARLGGDEFVVLLEQMTRPEEAATVARDLLAGLSKPFVLSSGHDLYVQASVGISVFPDDASNTAELLRDADTAMYRAKDAGGNRFLYFTGDMGEQVLADLELEGALRQALERNEFTLHYQPQIDLTDGRVYGAEALLRWRRAGGDFVSPARFIPIAEKTGLILPIGRWVLDAALAQVRVWLDEGLPDLQMAINVSALQFRSGDLDVTLEELLRRHALPARNVILELTESLLMEKPAETTKMLRRLKRIGIMLALDDFGTGFSSLAHLTRFPMDIIKIDASFVRGIGTDDSAMTVVNSIIELAHRMHLRAVAEGVETPEQCLYMKRQGCDAIQGYLFGRPVPADEFAKLLQRGRVRLPAD